MDPKRIRRRIEQVRAQLPRIPVVPDPAEEAAKALAWEKALEHYDNGTEPGPNDDGRIHEFLDILRRYGPAIDELIAEGILTVDDDGQGSNPSG
jgi:hypothetical protein